MSLELFNYEDHRVRTVVENGEPWFILNDVCSILGIGNPRNAAARLPVEYVRQADALDGRGIRRPHTIVSEAGLYRVVLRSDKAEAEPFQRWVETEVLPVIRKHGGYMTPAKIEEVLADPDTIIQLATSLKAERAARVELEQKVETDRPAVEYHEQFVARHDLITIRTLANQINVKETLIRDALVERKWLWRHEIERMNSKGQKVTEYKYGVYAPYKKYFVLVNNHTAPRLFGEVRTTVKVTPAGAQAVEKMFSKQEVLEAAA